MIDEDTLSVVLADLARTLSTDFSLRDILDRLVSRIVAVLPVTGAGVTLIAPGTSPRYIAASDPRALRIERLQTALGQGPSLCAYTSGEPVSVPDLGSDDRFPLFSPAAALDTGAAAVFTVPLRHFDGRFGALSLYSDTAGPLDAYAAEVAQTLADVTAAYLLSAWTRAEARADAQRAGRLGLYDALTGLPNRLLLLQRFEHAAARAERSDADAAVLCVTLDVARPLDHALGHPFSDEVLLAVTRRLAAAVRPGDTLARVSGNEFVILCEDLTDARAVDSLVSRITRSLCSGFVLSGDALQVSAGVRLAHAGPAVHLSERLVPAPDLASYAARQVPTGPEAGTSHLRLVVRQ